MQKAFYNLNTQLRNTKIDKNLSRNNCYQLKIKQLSLRLIQKRLLSIKIKIIIIEFDSKTILKH